MQNSDPSKKVVALGQAYFTIKTRKQELTVKEYRKLSEEIREEAIQRGIFIRDRKLGIVYCPMGEVLGKKSEKAGEKKRKC